MADDNQNPVFQIQRLYLKDLSLEQPNSPQILLEQTQPQVDINLALGAAPIADGIYEVTVTATVTTTIDTVYYSKTVIITTGTFLNGLIHIGDVSFGGGRAGEKGSHGLSGCLTSLGFEVKRLKTGTPPRLNSRSIDYSKLEAQHGDAVPSPFSFQTKKITQPQMPCHLTFTNEKTHTIIKENIFDRDIKKIPRFNRGIF